MRIWKVESEWSTEYVAGSTIEVAINKYRRHAAKEMASDKFSKYYISRKKSSEVVGVTYLGKTV